METLFILLGILIGSFIIGFLWIPKKTLRIAYKVTPLKTWEKIPVIKPIKPRVISIGYADINKRIKYAKKHNIKVDSQGRISKHKDTSQSKTEQEVSGKDV